MAGFDFLTLRPDRRALATISATATATALALTPTPVNAQTIALKPVHSDSVELPHTAVPPPTIPKDWQFKTDPAVAQGAFSGNALSSWAADFQNGQGVDVSVPFTSMHLTVRREDANVGGIGIAFPGPFNRVDFVLGNQPKSDVPQGIKFRDVPRGLAVTFRFGPGA